MHCRLILSFKFNCLFQCLLTTITHEFGLECDSLYMFLPLSVSFHKGLNVWHLTTKSIEPGNVFPHHQDRTSVTSDFIKPELDYLWVPPSRSSLSGLASLDKRAESVLKDLLTWLETLGAESNFETDLLLEELRRFIKDHNLETKKFFQLARLALTGSKVIRQTSTQ